MDNTLLECTFHLLSENTVKFEVDVGFARNLQKCNSRFTKNNLSLLHTAGSKATLCRDDGIVVRYMPFWRGLDYFGSLWENLA